MPCRTLYIASTALDRAVCVINIANGWYGYLPPRELYEKPVPSVQQTPFAKGALEFLIHGSLTQLERLCKQTHIIGS